MADWKRASKARKAAIFDFYRIPHDIKPSKPRVLVDHPDLERHVLKAVGELLAVHPKVSYALRVNSGAASFEAASGRYKPVWFHTWIRAASPYKMPDYFGATVDGRTIAFECKKPSWSKPTDEREQQQLAFLLLIRELGGIARFVTDAEQVNDALR